MSNLKKTLTRSLLALALCASGAAVAGPSYHVTIDTSTLGSGTAYLDLGLGADGGAAPVTAHLSGFSGDFGEHADRQGDSSGEAPDGVTLVNDASWSDVFQDIMLGGLLSFDVSFDGNVDMGGNPTGTSFSASLYNGSQTDYLGLPGPLVEIDLLPGQADMLSAANDFGSVGAANVPEPSAMLSMVTGLGLLGFGLRRRKH